jgi:hypothetical protein
MIAKPHTFGENYVGHTECIMNMNGWMGESGLGAGRMRESWDTLSTENGWYPGGVAVNGGYNGIKTF